MKTPEEQRNEYIAKCTHKRVGWRVYDIRDDKNTVEFDGNTNLISGINAAKRHVRTNNLKSYNG